MEKALRFHQPGRLALPDRRLALAILLLISLSALLLQACATEPPVVAAYPQTQSALQGSPDSSWLELDGYRLHWRHLAATAEPGAREQASRGKVLLIHGFGASLYCWRFTGPALAEAGFEVYEVDYPPFGYSESSAAELAALPADPPLGSPEARASLLWAFLDALDAMDVRNGGGDVADKAGRGGPESPGAQNAGAQQPWILVGHSLGGRIAARMAIQRPAATRALVLIAPAVYGAAGSPSLAASPLFRNYLAKNLRRLIGDPAQVKSILERGYGRPASPEELEGYLAPLRRPGAEAAMLAWAKTASELAEPRLASIRSPCLILWGTADRVVRNQGERLARDIPGARYVAFSGAGHILMETEAQRLDELVIGFLR